MHLNHILVHVISVALAAAAPTEQAVPDILLAHDEALLYGSGRFKIVKRWEADELEASRAVSISSSKPGYLEESMYTYLGNSSTPWRGGKETAAPRNSLLKRDQETIVLPWPSEPQFLGWDVQMSPVVQGGPEDKTTITVTSGSLIGNSISVGASADFTLIKDFLTVSTRFEVGKTWTSQQMTAIGSTVPNNKYGAMVSNAWTWREKGNVWSGTIGEDDGELRYYQADRFNDKKYDQLSWVDGKIVPCIGDTFPLKRCHGEGSF